MIECACLITLNQDKILLVRAHNQQKFCLPGGKIETKETPTQALIREINEELSVTIAPTTIQPLFSFVGKAYMQEHLMVKLNCFSAKWLGQITPAAEISEAKYISIYDQHKIAPTLVLMLQQHHDQIKNIK